MDDGVLLAAVAGRDSLGAASGVIRYYQDPIATSVCDGAGNSLGPGDVCLGSSAVPRVRFHVDFGVSHIDRARCVARPTVRT